MIIFNGAIRNHELVVTAAVDENGDLCFSPKGDYRFVVDTGFTGDIAVPSPLLSKLNLKFLNFTKFVLATHKEVTLPVFRGWVKIKTKRVKVEIVPGDELLGMGLLEVIGSKLIVDFDLAEVELIG